MPFSADSKPEQVSREVQELLRRKSELESDQTKLISKVVSSFVNSLVPGRSSGVAVPSQLDKVIDGDYNDPLVWDTVARLGFYREFMRSVSGQNFVIVLRASRLTGISTDNYRTNHSSAATSRRARPNSNRSSRTCPLVWTLPQSRPLWELTSFVSSMSKQLLYSQRNCHIL
jgi:hypothetical protein